MSNEKRNMSVEERMQSAQSNADLVVDWSKVIMENHKTDFQTKEEQATLANYAVARKLIERTLELMIYVREINHNMMVAGVHSAKVSTEMTAQQFESKITDCYISIMAATRPKFWERKGDLFVELLSINPEAQNLQTRYEHYHGGVKFVNSMMQAHEELWSTAEEYD